MGLIYLLDTNIISEPSKPVFNQNVVTKLEMKSSFSAVAAQTYYELKRGVMIMPEGKRKDSLLRYLDDYVLNSFPVVNYDRYAASINAEIEAKLRELGKPTPVIDTQLASIAMANNMILVTRNVKDFEPITEHFSLCVENWFEKG